MAPVREVTIARISDANPDMLRYFSDLGLRPNTRLTVLGQRPYADVTSIRVEDNGHEIDLGSAAAESIWVVAG